MQIYASIIKTMHLNSSTSLFRPETNNLLKCNPYDLRVFTHLLTTVRSCVEAIGEVEVKGKKERRRISTTLFSRISTPPSPICLAIQTDRKQEQAKTDCEYKFGT